MGIHGDGARGISGCLFRVAPDVVFQGLGKAGQSFLRLIRADWYIPIKEILSTFIDSYRGSLMMELRGRYFEYIKESKINLARIRNKIGKL